MDRLFTIPEYRVLKRLPYIYIAIFLGAFLAPVFFGYSFVYRDALTYVIPLKQFAVQQMLGGNIPFWNIYNGFGEPWMANPQTGLFYPFTYLFLLKGPVAFHLYLASHILILAVGTFRWLESRGGETTGWLIGAAAVSLSGPVLSALDIAFALSSLAYLPWTLLYAKKGRGAALALVLMLSFLAGEPMICGSIIMIASIAWLMNQRSLWKLVLVEMLFLLTILPQLYLTADLFLHSDRLAGLNEFVGFRHSLLPMEILEIFLGQGWGIASQEPLGFLQQTFLVSTYMGFALFPLLLFSLRRRPWLVVLFLVLIIVSMGSFTPAKHLISPLFLLFRFPVKLLLFVPFILAPLMADLYQRRASLSRSLLWPALLIPSLLLLSTSHPSRMLVHLSLTLLFYLIMLYKPEKHFLLPLILAADLIFSFLLFVHMIPGDFIKTARMLEPHDRDGVYFFIGEIDALNPLYFQLEGKYSIDSDRRLIEVGSGYSNLYTLTRMAATPAPMVTASYRRSKLVLPGLTSLIEIDTDHRHLVYKSVSPVPPIAWGEGVRVESVEMASEGITVEFEALHPGELHLGITYDSHWKVAGNKSAVISPDENSYISVEIDAGKKTLTLVYLPPILPMLIFSLLSLSALLVWYRWEQ